MTRRHPLGLPPSIVACEVYQKRPQLHGCTKSFPRRHGIPADSQASKLLQIQSFGGFLQSGLWLFYPASIRSQSPWNRQITASESQQTMKSVPGPCRCGIDQTAPLEINQEHKSWQRTVANSTRQITVNAPQALRPARQNAST